MQWFNEFVQYLRLPFVQYAFIVGVIIAFVSSLLGVILVLKRFSYIGDGLSHVAFVSMAVAGIVGLTNEMYLTLPVTVGCAIFLILRSNKSKINGDALVAMAAVGALAVGYLVMNLFPTSGNVAADVCTTLFGTVAILTLTLDKVILCIILAVIVILFFILFYNKIFSITFDENFAKATGVKVGFLNILIAVLSAVVIVLAMNLVGSLLISALIIFPALAAMRVFRTFKSVIISAGIISVVGTFVGICISILASTPVGCTIVVVDIFVFIIFYVIGLILKRS